MDNKYYTPEINEFYVGFEFEDGSLDPMGVNPIEWNYNTVDELNLKYITELYEGWSHLYRVKYLDKEDIESLGFVESPRGGRFDIKDLEGDEVQMYLYDHLDKGFWYIEMYNWNAEYIFRGRIKNKSELKKLLKQLGVC